MPEIPAPMPIRRDNSSPDSGAISHSPRLGNREDSHSRPLIDLEHKETVVGFVAIKRRVEHYNQQTRRREAELEMTDSLSSELARLRLNETPDQYDAGNNVFRRLGNAIRRWPERFIKQTLFAPTMFHLEKTRAREEIYSLEVTNSTLPVDFLDRLDTLARNDPAFRQGFVGRRLGWHNHRQMHELRMGIINNLKEAVNNSTNPNIQQFARDNADLVNQYRSILSGDYQASEAVAKRVVSDMGDDVIHRLVGEKAYRNAELTGPLKDFLNNRIAGTAITEALTTGRVSQETIANMRRDMNAFFTTGEFVRWYDLQPQEVKNALDVSMSYGTNFIDIVTKEYVPYAQFLRDQGKTDAEILDYIQNRKLNLAVGTLEAGPGTVVREGRLERLSEIARLRRGSDAQRVFELLRNGRDKVNLINMSDPDFNIAAERGRVIAASGITDIALSELLVSGVAGAATYALESGAKQGARILTAGLGAGVAGGAIRALKEFGMTERDYLQVVVDGARNLQSDERMRRRPELERASFQMRDMRGELILPIRELLQRMEAGNQLSQEELYRLLALTADTDARINIQDTRRILGNNRVTLLRSTDPQSWTIDYQELDDLRYLAENNLAAYFSNNQQQLIDISTNLGVAANAQAMIRELTTAQINHLWEATAPRSELQAVLGQVQLTENESVNARLRTFRSIQARRAVVEGAKAGVFMGGASVLGHLFTEDVVTPAIRAVDEHAIHPIATFIGEHIPHHVETGPSSFSIDKDFQLRLPNDYHITNVDTHAQHFTITGPDGQHHLVTYTETAQGAQISQSSLTELNHAYPTLHGLDRAQVGAVDTTHAIEFREAARNAEPIDGPTQNLVITPDNHIITLPPGYHQFELEHMPPGSQEVSLVIPPEFHEITQTNHGLGFTLDGKHYLMTLDSHHHITYLDSHGNPIDKSDPVNGYDVRFNPGRTAEQTAQAWQDYLASHKPEADGLYEQNNVPRFEHSNFHEWHNLTGQWRGYETYGHFNDGLRVDGNNPANDQWDASGLHGKLNYGQRLTDQPIQAWDQKSGFESPLVTLQHLGYNFKSDADIPQYIKDMLQPHHDYTLEQIIHDNKGDGNLIGHDMHGVNYVQPDKMTVAIHTVDAQGQEHVYFQTMDSTSSTEVKLPAALLNADGTPNQNITGMEWGVLTKPAGDNPHELLDPHQVLKQPLGSDVTFHVMASKQVSIPDHPAIQFVHKEPVYMQTTIITATEEYHSELGVDLPGVWDSSRRPLERPKARHIDLPSPRSPRVGFGPDETLAAYFRLGTPNFPQPGSTYQSFMDPSLEARNIPEGRRALETIHRTFEDSDHIYIGLSDAIGDVAFSTAYIDGIRQYAEKTGKQKKITLLVPPKVQSLLKPFADKYGYEVISEARYKCVDRAKDMIQSAGEKNAMIFDFDYNNVNPVAYLEQDKDNLIIHNLLSTSVGLYNNSRSGTDRFSKYLGDLLSIPQSEISTLKPMLVMPPDADDLYRNLESKYHIDANKTQISIVLEGSYRNKLYSLDNWKRVVDLLANSNREINIIYNPRGGNYTEDELNSVFSNIPGVRLVTLSIPEGMTFLQKQQLVLSNDTGFAHIATIVENGPKVVSLHLAENPPTAWVTNTERQLGITADSMNDIRPELVVQEARKILDALPHTQPGTPPQQTPESNQQQNNRIQNGSPLPPLVQYESAVDEQTNPSLQKKRRRRLENFRKGAEIGRRLNARGRVTLSAEQQTAYSQMEQLVREFYNRKIARLQIPADVPFVWPDIVYFKSRKGRSFNMGAGGLVKIDTYVDPSASQVGLLLAHELSHNLQRRVMYFKKDSAEGTLKAGLETISIHRDKREWNGICNGLSLWNEVDFDQEYIKQRLPAEYQSREQKVPATISQFSADELRLLGPMEDLQRQEIATLEQRNGFHHAAYWNLRMTQELAKLIGFQAKRQLPTNNNFAQQSDIQYGRDILEQDQFRGTNVSESLVKSIFTPEEVQAILKTNDDVSNGNSLRGYLHAMDIIRNKQRQLGIAA